MPRDLFNILLNEGLISEAQALTLRQEAEGQSLSRVEDLLLQSKVVSEDQLLQAKSEFFNLPEVSIMYKAIPRDVLYLIPERLAANYKMVAFERKDGVIRLAMADPGDFRAREAAEFIAREEKIKFEYFVALAKNITRVLRQYGSLKGEVKEALALAESKFGSLERERKKAAGEEFEEIIKSAPVSKMVSVIFRHAVEGRASDIHIEPGQDKSRVRYRIDGKLHTSIILPKYIHAAVVSRVKVLANLKIDETRIPQDGRIRQTIADKEVDFRVSTLPLVDNEKVVMRVLETSRGAPKFQELGFESPGLEVIERNLKRPNGLFLVTGPTGSGKSTTLFSALSILNQEGVNLTTLEDPVEYYVDGVNQSQIKTEVGFTFATGLRSILRQDPDIIMVGEIRDNETVELAIHAGLTGHLVLSTLHTNDAVGAIPRLIDMKAEPFLIGSTLNAIIAQRLVRKICPHCREEIRVPGELAEAARKELEKIPDLGQHWPAGLDHLKFYRSRGCVQCGNLGYQGRVAIFEVLEATERLKDIIAVGYQAAEVRKEVLAQGMLTLKQDGIIKALKGVTALEDVLEATAS